MLITVWLSMAAAGDVSVSWQTADDTALAGVDYTPGSGVLLFKRGEAAKTIEVDVTARATKNPRQFFIELSGPVNAVIADGVGECKLTPIDPNGPLVRAGLVTNAYDRQNGRGNYFHFNAGTSEGQSIGIEGALRAARVLLSGSDADKDAADWYRLLGIGLLNAVGTGSRNGPMLRQPFPTSADTVAQQFVGWNGSPFHGYQLPDHWLVLGAEAEAVHPTLTPADLLVADPATGVLSAPISGTDTDGRTKPKGARKSRSFCSRLPGPATQWGLSTPPPPLVFNNKDYP